jgi:hypothetical protein
MNRLAKVIDYLIIPLAIFFCAFEPNFRHGSIDYLEAGQYLAVINGIFHGKVLFKDLFIGYGPLSYYIPAQLMLIFGKSLVVLRGYFHFGNIFTLIIAYLLGRSILRSRIFSYLLAFLLLMEVNNPYWSTRWGGIKIGMGLLTLLLIISFIKSRKKSWLFLAGAVSSFAFLQSPEIGVFSSIAYLATVIITCGNERNNGIIIRLKTFVPYLFGVFTVLFPFFIYFHMKGILGDYLVNTFIILPKYYMKAWAQPVPPFIPLFIQRYLNSSNLIFWLFGGFFKVYLPVLIYLLVSIYLSYKLFKNVITTQVTAIIVLTVYGMLLYYFAFRAILGPQFQAALPPILILECFLLEKYCSYCKNYYYSNISKLRRIFVLLSLISLLSLALFYLFYSSKRYYGSVRGWFHYEINRNDITPTSLWPFLSSESDLSPLKIERAKGIIVTTLQQEEIEGVTKYIIENTHSQEPIFTFPEHGIYYFFTDRPASSKFTIAIWVFMKKEYQEELLNSLKQTRPRYIIFGKSLSNSAKAIGRKKELLPEISSFINENYAVVRKFHTIDIYYLK